LGNPCSQFERIVSVRKSAAADVGASDEALLAGMAIGDERAAVAFVRRYQQRVYGLAVTMVGDPALAEEIAQEALLRAWRHAQVFDPRRASVATWVLTITRNLAVDALRLRRAVPTDPEKLTGLGMVSGGASPAERAESSDLGERVRSALASLPVEQRRAVVLASMYGYTAAEVSEAESVPLGTAKTRIRAGLLKLRDAASRGDLTDIRSAR
jgi:RNA polymerase sigma factor (sigma-70 family)